MKNVARRKNFEIRKSVLFLLRAVPILKNLEKVKSEAGDAKTELKSSQTRSRTQQKKWVSLKRRKKQVAADLCEEAANVLS